MESEYKVVVYYRKVRLFGTEPTSYTHALFVIDGLQKKFADDEDYKIHLLEVIKEIKEIDLSKVYKEN